MPPNDNWANREVIPALPFTDVVTDVATATVRGHGPDHRLPRALISQSGNTLWYSYTTGAATEYVTLSTATSDYDTTVSVYEGVPGSFRMTHGGCNDDGVEPGIFQSRVTGVRLKANTTYSIEVTQLDPGTDPATLNLNIAPAATYRVTKLADTSDGTCDTDCSLREAVSAANATPGAVLIGAGTYTLSGAAGNNTNASGDLDVTTGMAIYGAGAGQTVINAANVDRVIHGDPLNGSRASVTLGDLTLLDGQVTGDGGGLLAMGLGNYTDLDSVVIDSSTASGNGGGIRMMARGRMVRTVVRGNQAGLAGGGINAPGNSDAIVEVRDSTIESNTSLATEDGRRRRASLDRGDGDRQLHDSRQHGPLPRRRSALPRRPARRRCAPRPCRATRPTTTATAPASAAGSGSMARGRSPSVTRCSPTTTPLQRRTARTPAPPRWPPPSATSRPPRGRARSPARAI